MSSAEEIDIKALITRFEAERRTHVLKLELERKALRSKLARVRDMTVKCMELIALQTEIGTLEEKITQKHAELRSLYAHQHYSTTPGTRMSERQKQVHASIQKIRHSSRVFTRFEDVEHRMEALIDQLDRPLAKTLRTELLIKLAKGSPIQLALLRAAEFATIAQHGMAICTTIKGDIARSRKKQDIAVNPGRTKAAAAEYHRCLATLPAADEALLAAEKAYVDALLEIKQACSICAEEEGGFFLISTPCAHCFHKECLLEWLKRAPTCPNCRAPVEEKDVR